MRLIWLSLVIFFSMKLSREDLFSFEYIDEINYAE
jgi:hypothetical protein